MSNKVKNQFTRGMYTTNVDKYASPDVEVMKQRYAKKHRAHIELSHLPLLVSYLVCALCD